MTLLRPLCYAHSILMKSTVGPAPQTPVRILLVDDNEHGIVARRRVLEDLGHTVKTAANGEAASDLFSAEKFDLVITDYKMPRLNGVELIRKLKKVRADVLTILLSGFVEPLGLNEQNTGADLVLAKSAGELGHLVRAIDRLLSRRIRKKPVRSQPKIAKVQAQSG